MDDSHLVSTTRTWGVSDMSALLTADRKDVGSQMLRYHRSKSVCETEPSVCVTTSYSDEYLPLHSLFVFLSKIYVYFVPESTDSPGSILEDKEALAIFSSTDLNLSLLRFGAMLQSSGVTLRMAGVLERAAHMPQVRNAWYVWLSIISLVSTLYASITSLSMVPFSKRQNTTVASDHAYIVSLLAVIFLREILFTFIYAFCNKGLALFSKYVLRHMISHFVGDREDYRVDIPFTIPQTNITITSYQLIITEFPIFVIQFSCFAFLFSYYGSGAIINPCTAATLTYTKTLYIRFTLCVIQLDILGHYSALLALYYVTPYGNTLGPTKMRVNQFYGCQCEFLLAFLNYGFQALTSHQKGSAKKTGQNVLFRQLLFLIGYPFSRAVINPASYLSGQLIGLTHTLKEDWKTIQYTHVPDILAYVVCAIGGAVLGTASVYFMQSRHNSKLEYQANSSNPRQHEENIKSFLKDKQKKRQSLQHKMVHLVPILPTLVKQQLEDARQMQKQD